MARKALIEKSNKKPKFSTRTTTRCSMCGRNKSYMRKFALCRICFRENAEKGKIPGVQRSSW